MNIPVTPHRAGEIHGPRGGRRGFTQAAALCDDSKLFGSLAAVGLVIIACVATGCGTLRNGRGWGQDAAWPIKWERIPKAIARTALDPATWVPAIGCAVFTIDDWDEQTARWASREQPFSARPEPRMT